MSLKKRLNVDIPFSIQKVIKASSILPLCGLFFCIIWSYVVDFEEATYTHCNVTNIAPSISASIGTFEPQKQIWQICVYMVCIPRLLCYYIYMRIFTEKLIPSRRHIYDMISTQDLIKLNAMFGFMEGISLLGLSTISSKQHFLIHKTFFGGFIGSASLYMGLSTYLFSKNCGQLGYDDKNEGKTISYQKKIRTVKRSGIMILLMLLFYWYHNAYCRPYAYSMFCISEYIVVLLNLNFHWCSFYDFKDISITIHSHNGNNVKKENDTLINIRTI